MVLVREQADTACSRRLGANDRDGKFATRSLRSHAERSGEDLLAKLFGPARLPRSGYCTTPIGEVMAEC